MLIPLFINILLALIIIYTFVTLLFIVASYFNNNSIIDIFYGPFIALCCISLIFINETSTPISLLLVWLISLWAIRLLVRILLKNWKRSEDPRYAAWRTNWMKNGQQYFLWRSYKQIFLLQGTIMVIVALPFIVAQSVGNVQGNWYTVAGSLIMLFGLGYETIADRQLDRFLKRKQAGTEPSPIMTTGLFKYSRRPNYFGEILVWWGLALIVFPLPYGYIALLSPILITYIVTRITGPMLEKIFLEKYPADYHHYMSRTSYFIPWFPKHNQTT